MSKEPTLRVAIIGAGSAGLTTAIALRKFPGIDVQIYERATELRELGQAIALGPNGLRTLDKLGVHKVVDKDFGFYCPSGYSQTFRHWKTNEMLGRHKYEGDMVRFYRPHLQEALLEHLPGEIIHLKKRFVDVKADPDKGVDVTFADGAIVHVDLLIGADGINSAVRKLYAPDYQVKWSGLVAYRSAFDAKLLDGVEDLPKDATQFWSPNEGLLTTGLTKGMFGIVAFHQVDPIKNPDLTKRTHWDEIADVSVVRDLFKDFHPVVRTILERTPNCRVYPNFYGGFLDTFVFDNRVVLLGDAARSNGGALGANTSMAIDDAYALYLSFLNAVSPEGKLNMSSEKLEHVLMLYNKTRLGHSQRVLGVVHNMYRAVNERLWNGEPETDEAFRKRVPPPDAAWVHEYDVTAEFERVRDEMQGAPVQDER